jgi:cytochrome o ubiquinol oxidase operon protein cyoD
MKKSFEVVDEKFESSRDALFSYVTGFALSILLSFIPYVMVTEQMFGRLSLVIGVTFFAVAQLVVQVVFFLHLPAKKKPYWNIVVFVYTLLIVAFLVIGSLWIMYHLNYNMMGVTPFKSNEGYIPQ